MTADESDPYPRFDRELGLLLRRARASMTAMSERLHPDLDPSAYPLLGHVSRTPGVRSSDLAAHIGVGRATISRQVHRLEALGLVSRRPDPQDARGQLLELTPEGTQFVLEAQDTRRRWLRSALASWPADDVAALAASLGRLNDSLDEATQACRATCEKD